ncbi:MAG: epoxyqueuosine reductase QueH [Candidatus Omnitrophica bacterium]|nr:epoxyqueuosine reductase QueH [Candidatus Omnitrophota bacterium]
MKKVLLHICCAGCGGVCIERLQEEGFEVLGFFYNPNIHPPEEYLRRQQDLEKLEKEFSLEILSGDYEISEWFNFIKGYEAEPEGGRRCGLCFELRLRKSYEEMKRKGLDFFTTTLSVSPHKNSRLIKEIGEKIDKDRFLFRDFKKKDGFKRSVELSKKLGLYRQNYCGCLFSQRT